MNRLIGIVGLACAIAANAALCAETEVGPISGRHAREWLRWVIPLPKEAQIKQKVTVSAPDVRLVLHGQAGPLERNALRKLRSLFLERAGVDGSTGGDFEIVLGVCDEAGKLGDVVVPDAARLRELPNAEQAYLVRPIGTSRLVLAALDTRGLFYAALTVRQLLEAEFRGDRVTVPLATITDWPDLAERGEWGTSSVRDIEWLADRKMNLVEFHCSHQVAEDGRAISSIGRARLRRGRLNGVKMVPIISHLNGMGRRGAYRAYPELRGKGKAASHGDKKDSSCAPCASHPQIHQIMADWMCGYAANEGVRDICCWLSEPKLRCECEECAKYNQFALETRAFVRAWRIAKQRFPDLRIRVLLTQGSYNSNDKVLPQVPPEVGVTYYDGGRTYDSSQEPMIYPLLEDYASKGRWLGCYPQLTASWRIVSPWSCPQFVKFRMTEFVDKKLSSLGGYVVPDNRLYEFNVTAAAEWSWNAHGRDEREFAIAWAIRQKLTPPEVVADWAVMLGQASWDLYGARLVERYFFRPGTIETVILSGAKPMFGQGFLTYIRDQQHLRRNMAVCRKALQLANQVGSTAMVAETKAIVTYYDMVNQLCRICAFLAEHGTIDAQERQTLQEELNRFTLAGGLNVEALRDWERAVAVGAGLSRFREGVQATEDTVQTVARALERFGVRNPSGVVASRQIGEWSSDDFRETGRIVKEFDVTQDLVAPGTFSVTFQYTVGWNGLGIYKVALVAEPKGRPGERAELTVDDHWGSTAIRSQGNVYTLTLDKHDPSLRYWIVATIRGKRPQDQPLGKKGCSGFIRLRRERGPDWQIRLMNVPPYAEAETPRGVKAAFSGDGVPVGLVVGGYGSKGVLELLQKSKGVDVLAVGIGQLRPSESKVIILPQFRSDMVPEQLVKTVESFVRAGGGLITTHDAVGYRSMPPLCTTVCEGGAAHVRHERWKVSADHPIAAGLPKGVALAQGYFDHIQLKCGKDGAAVAVSEKTGKPVVVAGTFGKGRYVACGLLLGLDPSKKEAPPAADEARLLINAIRWCAGEQ